MDAGAWLAKDESALTHPAGLVLLQGTHPSGWLADYSHVDVLHLRYEFVNFGVDAGAWLARDAAFAVTWLAKEVTARARPAGLVVFDATGVAVQVLTRPLSSKHGTFKRVTARFWRVKVLQTF